MQTEADGEQAGQEESREAAHCANVHAVKIAYFTVLAMPDAVAARLRSARKLQAASRPAPTGWEMPNSRRLHVAVISSLQQAPLGGLDSAIASALQQVFSCSSWVGTSAPARTFILR